MKRFCALCLTLLATALVGCSKQPEPKGVNVTTPGVNIQVNPGGGAIGVPGVQMKVDGKEINVPNVPNINITVPK